MTTVVGKTRRNASVESICTCVAPASALYDTHGGSHNSRYVNHPFSGQALIGTVLFSTRCPLTVYEYTGVSKNGETAFRTG